MQMCGCVCPTFSAHNAIMAEGEALYDSLSHTALDKHLDIEYVLRV